MWGICLCETKWVLSVLPRCLWGWMSCAPRCLLELIARCYASSCAVIINYDCDSGKDRKLLRHMSLDDKGEASITHDRKVKGNLSLPGMFLLWRHSLLNIRLWGMEIPPVTSRSTFPLPFLSPSFCEKQPNMILKNRWNKNTFIRFLRNVQCFGGPVITSSFCLN